MKMVILKGTILSPPKMKGRDLLFFLRCGKKRIAVIRRNLQAQKRDMIFLCPGQRVILCGQREENSIIAEKIRILLCSRPRKTDQRNGAKRHGDYSTVSGAEQGDP